MKLTLQDIKRLQNNGSLIISDERFEECCWFIYNENNILDIYYGNNKAPLRCVTIGVNMKKDDFFLQNYLEKLLTRAYECFVEETKPKYMHKKYVA